jgi:citrate synthase
VGWVPGGRWIDAAEAAERLGVKPATLYAYVSRGVLTRRREPGGRSRFDSGEVEQLARRGRPRRAASPSELVIESQLTELRDGRPFYRGLDALELAGTASFEDVAEWLWTGSEPPPPRWRPNAVDGGGTDAERPHPHGPGDGSGPSWQVPDAAVAAGRAAQSGLSPGVLPLERLQLVTCALAAADRLRHALDPPAVATAGRTLITGLVECLPGRAAGSTVHERLWTKLTNRTGVSPAVDLLDAVRAALVLLADHELAASTLAVRVAASVLADPYAAVSAGLGVVGGALHGGASLGVESVLSQIDEPDQAGAVLGERLRRGERIPGFGHSVYTSGDRRATALFEHIRAAVPGHERLAVAEAVLAEARQRRLPEPNVDFALGTLVTMAGMVRGAGEAIFAIARTAGWIAHAAEEYGRRSPLRLRAVYTGPAPQG